jgi:4-amino-4-deoxy-L-arabinose transferase-like glycosyltransferase
MVTVLLVGGLLLVLLAQQCDASLMGQRRLMVNGLLLAGLASFALGVYLMARPWLPVWLGAVAGGLAAFLGVSSGQVMLLLYAPGLALLAGLAAGGSLQALNLPVSIGAYSLAVVAVVAGAFRPNEGLHGRFERRDWLIAGTLFGLAFGLRLINLDGLPPTLSGDEGSTGLQAVSFIQGEADNLFSVGWFSFPSLSFAVQSIGIGLLGQTTAGLRLMSALAGALTVAGLYWLVLTGFGRLVAVMAAFVLATLHYHIHFSRLGVNNIWDGLFAVLTLAGLAHGWRYERRLGFIIAGLGLGLGQYFYVSFRVMPLLLLLWAVLALVFDRERFRRLLPDLILSALIAFVVALPLLLYFAGEPDEFFAPMRRVTVFGGWLEQMAAMEGQPAPVILARQVARTAAGITHVPLRHWYNPGSPLLLPASAGLFLLGLLWLLLRPRLLGWLVLLPILAVILLGGLSQDAPASQRYILATPALATVVAIPLAVVARWLWRAWPRYQSLIAVTLVLGLGWLALSNLQFYFFEVFDSYVLGGPNTQTATAIAHYLNDQEPSPKVYFFGPPRMGYHSLATIPYLAPQVMAEDINQPLDSPPDWPLASVTIFLFLPERQGELALVSRRYPGGTVRQIDDAQGQPLFLAYELVAPTPPGQ